MTPTGDIQKEVTFLDTPAGRRLITVTRPATQPRGGWLYLHPFAEEMNKTRRMIALSAQALAKDGWLVVQLDLAGCGDSEGELRSTEWQSWIDDISQGWNWLSAECPGNLGIWTLRAGSLLAAEWLKQHDAQPHLLLWQPVRNGKQHLTQFLRLVTANEMLTRDGNGNLNQLRSDLESGSAIDVAGYTINPSISAGMNAAHLELPVSFRGSTIIIEVIPDSRNEPSPGIQKLAQALADAEVAVTLATATGVSFWQTVEIETAPALVDVTVRELGKL